MFKKYFALILLSFISAVSFSQVTAGFSTDNPSGNYCVGDSVFFTNTSTGNYVTSYWNFGDNLDTWAENPFHIYNTAGTFTVNLTVADNTGTSSSASKSITINPKPSVTLVNNKIEQSLTVRSDENDVTYRWLFNADTTDATDTIIYYLESGLFTVVATNTYGCSASASIKIDLNADNPSFANDSLKIIVKNNILTPGIIDGANDVLFIDDLSSYSSACNVLIYNKWGQIVYINDNYSNLGGFAVENNNGRELDAGTYYYVIKTENRKTATGFVDLIR